MFNVNKICCVSTASAVIILYMQQVFDKLCQTQVSCQPIALVDGQMQGHITEQDSLDNLLTCSTSVSSTVVCTKDMTQCPVSAANIALHCNLSELLTSTVNVHNHHKTTGYLFLPRYILHL